MKFKDLRTNDTFRFADPVEFSIGRTFYKVSARCYRMDTNPFSDDMGERMEHAEWNDVKFEVGSVNVEVEKA